MDTPLTGTFRTAGHRAFFEPKAPSHLKIGGRHTKTNLSRLALPSIYPPQPPNNVTLTCVSRFGIFTWSTVDYLLTLSDWDHCITETEALSLLNRTEGSVPHTFTLCPHTIEVKHTFRANALSQISALFTERTKKWMVAGFPPHIAGGFIDRTLNITHRQITPSLSQLWMKL